MQYKLLKTDAGEVRYKTRKSRKAKRVSIVIQPEGWAELVIPWLVPEYLAEAFLRKKRNWVIKKIRQARGSGGMLALNKKGDYQRYKDLARDIVKEKIRYYNDYYGFKVEKVFIRNQKSRWGSCSSNGNLSFNYKIVYLSEALADYLVVHELCHLKEMNHSEDFWRLVEKAVPNCRYLSKKLRRM